MQPDSSQLFGDSESQTAPEPIDIEEIGGNNSKVVKGQVVITVGNKRKRAQNSGGRSQATQSEDLTQHWKDVLGPQPPIGNTKVRCTRTLAT